MKAISKFKALLARSRQAGRKRTTHAGSGDDEGSSQAASTPQSPDPESKAANAEAAAALVRLRRERSLRETTAAGNFSGIATALGHLGGTDGTVEDSAKGTQPGSPGNANGGVLAESSGRSPLILGIGTGGQDDFATFAYDSDEEPPPPANVVSDSPAVVDFNVYDAAYGAEVARIRAAAAAEAAASTSGGGRRGSRQRTDSVGAGAASAPTTTVYLTRLVENPPVNDGDAIVMKADAGSDRDGEDHKMRDCADTVLHDTAVEGPQSQTEARPQATLPTAATTAAAAWSPVDTPGTADSRDLRSSSSAVPSANALSGSSFQDIVAQAMKNKAAM